MIHVSFESTCMGSADSLGTLSLSLSLFLFILVVIAPPFLSH